MVAQPFYNEVLLDTPIVVTTSSSTTAVRLLGETYPYRWVTSVKLRMQSLGGGTYAAVGTEHGQEWRLDTVGDEVEFRCNKYEVIDLTKMFIVADHDDLKVEVWATFLPARLLGQVLRAA